MSDLVQRLLDRAYSSKATDALCEEAAKEIERLNVAITSYAASSEAAAREINQLRAGAQRPSGDIEVLRLRLQAAHAETKLLRTATRRLADQDATLSMCDGAVTVTMGGTLTDAERESLRFCIRVALPETEKLGGVAGELCRIHRDRIRGLLERLG